MTTTVHSRPARPPPATKTVDTRPLFIEGGRAMSQASQGGVTAGLCRPSDTTNICSIPRSGGSSHGSSSLGGFCALLCAGRRAQSRVRSTPGPRRSWSLLKWSSVSVRPGADAGDAFDRDVHDAAGWRVVERRELDVGAEIDVRELLE